MGIAAAIGGAAVVGAGASIYGADKASSAAKDAANSNNALEQQLYAENSAALSPYESRGNAAGSAINALLGLGGSSSSTSGTPNYAAYVQNSPDLLKDYTQNHSNESMVQYGETHWADNGQYEGRTVTPYSTSGGSSGTSATDAANAAFANWQGSTGYQQQLQTGQNQVQAALGAKGLLDSGAAQKALLNYGQQAANSSFQTYLGDLSGQQSAGLAATSAQAGVSQNYGSAVSANNNAAATAIGNAALSGANSVNSTLSSALSAYNFNQALGSSYGSSALGASNNAYGIAGSDGIY